MGRSPCCDKVGLKKGPWTPEEDQKLLAYIEQHGHGSWRALPSKAGLQRCGKSCRLRWTNYLRPDIKRGKFNVQEEQTIIQLHALLGNRWSAIATHLPKRTDNEIKNYWNTHLKKRLAKMGIDPVTHKPKNDALLTSSNDGNSKSAANLSHMAQWESARLEAEARLARQSKLRSASTTPLAQTAASPACLEILKAWGSFDSGPFSLAGLEDPIESPTSTLSYSDIKPAHMSGMPAPEHLQPEYKHVDEFPPEMMESAWTHDQIPGGNFVERFTDLLLSANSTEERCLSEAGSTESVNAGDGTGNHCYEDNKIYWDSILNLVNSSPSDSPMF
ncbi:unnamed protein product [Cuscuta europaea]|uniref:Uncharacterized protein n=1 Tax=Cuscuta europaea TaxID=41803 RepID=A0A9P0Z2I0_CUSEU|nr:unnamed protein product [Cuscuta europaea]